MAVLPRRDQRETFSGQATRTIAVARSMNSVEV
jgi:hypothetical protein